VNLTK